MPRLWGSPTTLAQVLIAHPTHTHACTHTHLLYTHPPAHSTLCRYICTEWGGDVKPSDWSVWTHWGWLWHTHHQPGTVSFMLDSSCSEAWLMVTDSLLVTVCLAPKTDHKYLPSIQPDSMRYASAYALHFVTKLPKHSLACNLYMYKWRSKVNAVLRSSQQFALTLNLSLKVTIT